MNIIHIIGAHRAPVRKNEYVSLAHQLALKQHNAGHEVSVWHIAGAPGDGFPAKPYPIRSFGRRPGFFRLPAVLEAAILRQSRNTVFHLHGAFQPTLYMAASVMSERDVPYVITPYGSYLEAAMQQRKLLKHACFRLFELPLLRSASAIHLTDVQEKEALHEWYHSRKSVFVNYAAEKEAGAGFQKAMFQPSRGLAACL